jgi:hypothetical protein
MIVAVVVVVALVAAALVALGVSQHGRHSAFLEWDPEERTAWLGDQESVDLVEMLELHNDARRRRGLEPATIDEFRDQVRRENADG